MQLLFLAVEVSVSDWAAPTAVVIKVCGLKLGMARYHNFGFGTIPECNTSVSILNLNLPFIFNYYHSQVQVT